MLWAACHLAFFGFLCCSNFTVPTQESFDEAAHLSNKDVSVNGWHNPQLIYIQITQFKTDPFRKGMNLMLNKTDEPVCLITALLPYLGQSMAPSLFLMANSNTLHLHSLVHHYFTYVLQSIGISTQDYNTHSFWFRVATSAKATEISDLHTKMLGRWQSDAYQSYIKTPPGDLAKFSTLLLLQCDNHY